MEETYSIKELIDLMLAKLWLIIVLTIVGGGAAFGYAKIMMPLKYSSFSTMYVKNNEVSSSESVNLNDLNASKSLVSTYATVLRSSTVMNEVSDTLLHECELSALQEAFVVKTNADGSNYITTDSLLKTLTMGAVDSTEVMKISAVTTSPEVSAALCNAVAEAAPSILKRVVGAGSVETIDAAVPNASPVSPNVPKTALLGAAAGFILAVMIIFCLDLFDNTVKDSEKISAAFHKAMIGEIQEYSVSKQQNAEQLPRLTSASDVPFHIQEAYKAMRTNISFALAMSDKRLFAVSSPNPSEGKSTTAVNIAISLAQMEQKVLLIDGDLRKPVQHKLFRLKNTHGLSTAIGKMSKLEDCIHKNALPYLDIMPAGPQPPNPSELLASGQCAEMLKTLSEDYDYVLIDTPPVNVVSDVLGLSNSVAGLLLVLRYGKTTMDDVNSAMKKMELSQMNHLGFVLNAVKKNRGGSYGYYHSKYGKKYGYGYGAKPTEETAPKKEEAPAQSKKKKP